MNYSRSRIDQVEFTEEDFGFTTSTNPAGRKYGSYELYLNHKSLLEAVEKYARNPTLDLGSKVISRMKAYKAAFDKYNNLSN